MIESIEDKINNSIKRRKNGAIFFASDFARFGNGQAVNKALERLAKSQKIIRLSKGIYCKPKIDTELGDYDAMQKTMIYGDELSYDKLILQIRQLEEMLHNM